LGSTPYPTFILFFFPTIIDHFEKYVIHGTLSLYRDTFYFLFRTEQHLLASTNTGED
jgi:hypothetical protein